MENQTEKSRHSVETEALQNVLNYLNSRPYGEVLGLVEAIMKSQQPVQPVQLAPPAVSDNE